MRRPFLNLIVLFILVATIRCSEKKTDNRISIGIRDSLYSEVLKEQRSIHVYVPDDAYDADTSKHYPVLYLLDGDYHFHSVTGILHQLSDNGLCPEMIVVAIPNTDRSRDLTPTHATRMPNGEVAKFLQTTGGAENFTTFIKTELMPYIESHYPTAPHRVLVGHSFGGLFVINALVNHPDLFSSYVAIDPSMWWDDSKLLLQSDTVLRENKFDGKSLFVSMANTMPSEMDTARVHTDTTDITSHIRSIIHFAKTAQANSAKNGLHFSWKYYPEDSHGSVPLISQYDALRFIFNFYRLELHPGITAEDFRKHFEESTKKLGYTMLPPERRVNEAGYYFLREKKYDQARDFFELNIKNYPQSGNVYDSMGDYYVAIDDKAKAIEFFKKALAINQIEDTQKKLDNLQRGN